MHERKCVYSTANNGVLSSLVRLSIVVGEQVRNPVMESTVTTPAAEDIGLATKDAKEITYSSSQVLILLFSYSR